MSSSETFVVVGAGLAGGKAVEALRERGFDGRIVLIGAEPHRPYERPPMSKGYLTGDAERESVFVHGADWYIDNDVELWLDQVATAIDRADQRLDLTDGTSVRYDKLLIATGASSRKLKLPGADAAGVRYLRTLDDSEALRNLFGSASRLVVIGAGWIGLEVSAAARQAGVEVTIVEAAELPLLRVLGPEVARIFAELHREHGVRFLFGASLAEILTADDHATGVRLGDGTVIEADAVLVAVGASPNTRLAETAGLGIDNGVVADASLRTIDPRIFAAGDVVNALHPFYGKHIRVEHWANALNQPATAAHSMLGDRARYIDLPYFYTDQYDLGMEYIGYADGNNHQVVFRGDVDSRTFLAFWLSGARVVAGMNVNVWDVGPQIEKLIRSRAAVDTNRLADPDTPLDDVVETGKPTQSTSADSLAYRRN